MKDEYKKIIIIILFFLSIHAIYNMWRKSIDRAITVIEQ